MKDAIDVRSNWIIRDGENGNTVKGATGVKNLCQFCARAKFCPENKRMQKTERSQFGIQSAVIKCKGYIPSMIFSNADGWVLHRSANSIRLGHAWSQRVIVGQKVALITSTDKKERGAVYLNEGIKCFGVAKISQQPACLPKQIALDTHAWYNHSVLHERDAMTRHEAADRLRKIMIQSYGKNRLEVHTRLSVITMTPIATSPQEIKNVFGRF